MNCSNMLLIVAYFDGKIFKRQKLTVVYVKKLLFRLSWASAQYKERCVYFYIVLNVILIHFTMAIMGTLLCNGLQSITLVYQKIYM